MAKLRRKTKTNQNHKQMKNNQNTLPAQLDEQVKNSGIELSEAQSLAANYAPFFEVVAAKEAELKLLEKGNAAHVASAKRIRIDLGKTCSALDSVKSEHKKALLTRTRYIDGLFNAANGYARLTQEAAKEIEDHFERMEAERKSKLRDERAAQLVQFEGLEPTTITEMSDAEWANYLVGVEAGFKARIEAEAKAKAEAEAAAEAERQRIAEQAAENARLKSEAEKREADLIELRNNLSAKAKTFLLDNGYKECHGGMSAVNYHHFIGENHYGLFDTEREYTLFTERVTEQSKLESARKEAEEKAAKERAEFEAKAKAEREAAAKVAAELQAKKDAEAKAEADRLKAEAEAEAARIKAAKAPVKDKLNAWVKSFSLPSTDVSNSTTNVIEEKFNAFKAWAETQVENI
jgi:colicin import membrane protein